jgi:hypothetical protein
MARVRGRANDTKGPHASMCYGCTGRRMRTGHACGDAQTTHTVPRAICGLLWNVTQCEPDRPTTSAVMSHVWAAHEHLFVRGEVAVKKHARGVLEGTSVVDQSIRLRVCWDYRADGAAGRINVLRFSRRLRGRDTHEHGTRARRVCVAL